MKSIFLKRLLLDTVLFAYFFCIILVAIFQPTQQELLNLTLNFQVFSFGVLIGVLLSFLSHKVSKQRPHFRTLGELIFSPQHEKTKFIPIIWYKTLWGWQLLIFVVFTFVVGTLVTKFSLFDLLDEDGFQGAVRLFKGLSNPNFKLLPKAVINIIETIFMAFMATALAIPIAFVLSFLAAKNIMKNQVSFLIYLFLRTALNVVRSIEALIWAIIFSVWVGIGPFAGMLALMVHSIASLTKQYSEIVETVDEGPIEGILSTGASALQVIWFAIVPQVILPFISFTIYRWDINIRMATIIGLVGGGGIGTLLIQYQGQAMWPEVGTIILVIAFVVWFMDTASAHLREALK